MSKKSVEKAAKFPETVYVYWDEFGEDESFLLVTESPQNVTTIGTKTLVGIYHLSSTVYAEGKVELTEAR